MTHWIDGQWVAGQGEAFTSLSPYDATPVWHGNSATASQVKQAVDAASKAFIAWRNRPFPEREAYVLAFAEQVKKHHEDIAEVIAKETGKPLWEARTEMNAMAGKMAISIQAYHERTGEKHRQVAQQSMVLRHRPLGVLAVFGPYNFPAHLPNGHMIPALLAGNTVVLKPSEQTPWTGEWIMKLWEAVGLPKGVVNLVQGAKETGMALAQAPDIDGILFTGSANTGHALHRQLAGQPDKMLALEMGGNNPMVVSQQCQHLDAAVYTIIQSAFLSAGQRCTCARRLYLPEGEKGQAILEALVKVSRTLVVGEPFSQPAPFMGSQISQQAAQSILKTQKHLQHLGGKSVLEARILSGALLTPGIMDVSQVDVLPDEEYFGPLLQVAFYQNLPQAVKLANNTRFGLSAGLISDDDDEWQYFLEHIRAGIVNRNNPLTGASGDAPFGGPGASGNLRPSAYYAADYCAYPMASVEGEQLQLPETLLPGITLLP